MAIEARIPDSARNAFLSFGRDGLGGRNITMKETHGGELHVVLAASALPLRAAFMLVSRLAGGCARGRE